MYYVISIEFAGSGRRNDYADVDTFLRQRFHATKIMKRQWILGKDFSSAHHVYGAIHSEFAGLFGDDDKLLVVSLPDKFCENGQMCQAWAATGISKLRGQVNCY